MNLESLIAKLAKEGAGSPIIKPRQIFILCSLVLFFYLIVLLYFFGLREDFALIAGVRIFQIELLLNIAVIFLSIISLSLLRLPDFNNQNLIKFAPVLFFVALFIVICCKFYFNNGVHLLCSSSNLRCLVGIVSFSIIPMIFLVIMLYYGVMTNFTLSFLAIGIASGSLSYLAERLMHETENVAHLLLWHFLPTFIVIMISALIIKIFIKSL